MGVVRKTVDTNLDREVMPPEAAARPDRLERFAQEARTTGSLDHPKVVAIHDLGRHEDAPYIVMELEFLPPIDDRLRFVGGGGTCSPDDRRLVCQIRAENRGDPRMLDPE